MTAIYGIVAPRAGALDPALSPLLRRGFADRAGDEGGDWSADPVALGCAGPADAHPVADGGRVIVADARLDNRAELGRALGLRAGDVPDSRLILAAHRRWGSACPQHLVGAFAFAIWDGGRGALFCARDHMGLRPFHYWLGGGEFVFASEAGALLATGRPSGEVDETAFVATLVSHHGILKERSLHAGIAKLPPGESLEVTPGGRISRTTYWAPGPREPVRLSHRDDYADALREALECSVAAAVRGERHVGAHFSGGLDSSAVAVIAQRALQREGNALVRLFSWSPEPVEGTAPDDERERVMSLAASLGVGVSWAELTPAGMDADFHRDVELIPNDTALYEYLILGEARERGIETMLSGWGGDEVASYRSHRHSRWLARSGRWRELFRETGITSRRRGLRGPRLAGHVALRMVAAARSGADRGAVWVDLGEVHPLAGEMQRDIARRTRCRLSPRDTQIALLASGHLTSRIEAWAYAGARAGVDYRYPMLDRRLIDLCLAFPPELWVKDGFSRWVFRRAMAPILPDDLCWGTPKHEPARIDTHLDLFLGGWEAPPGVLAPDRARLVALRLERQRAEVRRQRA